MKYKLSEYNYHYIADNDFIVYNTRSGAILTGTIDEFDLTDFLKDISNYFNHEYFKTLIDCGVVVDSNIDELEEIKRAYHTQEKEMFSITVVPTLSCNFRCPYCYVNTIPSKQKKVVSPVICERILKYIKQEMLDKDYSMCQIIWFGGEPTLALEVIEDFMKKLSKLSEEVGFLTTSTIVTNGYLLSEEFFLRLYNSNVRIFQVTLDGVKINHDLYRVLEDGSGTFERIYNNLRNISTTFENEEFSVSVRANFLKHNLVMMQSFLDKFYQNFGNDNRFTLSFRPIIDFGTSISESVASKKQARYMEACLLKRMIQLDKKYIEDQNPMFNLLPTPIVHWCRIRSGNYIVKPEGELCYCDSCISDEEIGYLLENGEIRLKQNSNSWLYDIFEDGNSNCLKCKRLPICMGGCILERKRMGKYTCHWTDDYIMDSLEYLIKV